MSALNVQDWPLQQITPYENNPRRNDDAVGAVAKSLREFGWQQPLVVDKHGVLIVGHTRLLAAKSLGWKVAPVVVADKLTPAQVKSYRLADNRVGEIAQWDETKLFQELEGLLEAGIDLEGMGFSQEELGLFQKPVMKEDFRYLEDFEVIPAPKPKWILIMAPEDGCAAILAAVKNLGIADIKMEYSGAAGSHPTNPPPTQKKAPTALPTGSISPPAAALPAVKALKAPKSTKLPVPTKYKTKDAA